MTFSSEFDIDIDQHAIEAVRGFRFAGIAAGIKSSGKPDLGLILADGEATVAGVFTKNLVRAAPVELAEAAVKAGRVRAVLVNSGNANACTGAAGLKAAKTALAALAKKTGIPVGSIAPASTGVIGAVLPADTIVAAIPRLLDAAEPGHAADFARAIMTTDQWPKVAERTIQLGKRPVRILGIAKGAGMIHPNMATTLAFVVTDAAITAAALRAALRDATDRTFNSMSVDGDTSTNDTILALASGVGPSVTSASDRSRFREALSDVLGALARNIVRDGEGARHVVEFEVRGARTPADARRAAATIATSPLVKTALHGRDANWGRILAAAGRSGAKFDPSKAAIAVEADTRSIAIVKKGMPIGKAAEAEAAELMALPSYRIRVDLGSGKGSANYLTCDFGHSYIDINANYRS